MISQKRLERALTYLAETDEPCARALGMMEGLKRQLKTIEAQAFLEEDGSAAVRSQKALSSQQYIIHNKKYEDSVVDYHILRNKRITETLIIEVWRSLEASRRHG